MRRYDLDWLRVNLFGLLILYHVGMFFVPWGYHLKNNFICSALTRPMLFLNQWRLPALFLISGMGTYYALGKRSGAQFARERLTRLLLPLTVGILLVIPPQVYFERLDQGQFSGSYLDFWPTEAFKGIYPAGNFSWHHLWFLPYLFIFSLLLLPILLYLRHHPQAKLFKRVQSLTDSPLRIFWLTLPLFLWEAFLEPFFPSTHALIGDWFNLVNYLTFFFYGFLMISIKDRFWATLKLYRRHFLYCGIVAFVLMISLRMVFEDSLTIHFIEAFFKVVNMWAWILTLLAYGAVYLNRTSQTLVYANEAVYPFYILHQTIMLAIGFYIKHLYWSWGLKFLLMTVGTFGLTWLFYEFGIRRWTWIRPLFGLRNKSELKTIVPPTLVK